MPDILGALTAGTPAESIDVLSTWVGGIAVLRYRLAIGRRREHSPLERRAAFLISAIAALLIIRGFSWLRPDQRWLGTVMLAPAALLPLAMTLFVEGLLRRHMPRWVKWLATLATLLALVGALGALFTGRDSDAASGVLLVCLVISMVVIVAMMALRDRQSLSRAENGLVRACMLSALIGLPLAATDFRFIFGWPPARLGTIGALLFCYTLLRRHDERGLLARWWRDVAILVVRAAIVCVLLLLALRTAPPGLLFPLGALATTLVLAMAVNDRIAEPPHHGSGAALLRWLAREPATSLAQFQRELKHLPLTADALVLGPEDLAPYDHDALRAALSMRGAAHSITELRTRRADSANERAARGADELTDLLERSGMTHAALLAEHPLRLLLATVPDLPGSEDAALALAAVARHGQLAALEQAS